MRLTLFSATRNAAGYVGQCVRSVREQTHTDWEMFLVDDASDDATRERAIEAIGADDRIRCVSRAERRRKLANFLDLLPEMSGDVIVNLDADDWLATPTALTSIASAYDDPEVDATVGRYQIASTGGLSDDVEAFPAPPRFSTSIPHRFAPRTWRRVLSLDAVARWPTAWIDPTTHDFWASSDDISMWGPVLVLARRVVALKDVTYIVNDLSPNRDNKLEIELQARCADALIALWARLDEEHWRQ